MNSNIEPTILYEDQDIMAVNKPAGLIVHSDGKTEEPTLCDWLVSYLPSIKGVGEPMVLQNGITIDRPGIVHRLDRGTSGIMLVAKHQQAHEFLKKQFQAHAVTKVYEAFVYGIVKDDSGRIDRPIGRSGADFRRWSAQRGTKGQLREAITDFKTLARCMREPKSGMPVSVLALMPITGRTHQIRVHCKAINHPLVGDSLYAPNQPKILGFERPALHSRQISFISMDNEQKTIIAPYPHDFQSAIETLASGGISW